MQRLFPAGALYAYGSHTELYLTPTTPDLLQKAQDKVRITCGWQSDELAGVHESIAAVTPPNSTGINAGFLRLSARLAIVQVAEEDEIAPGAGPNVPPESAASQYNQLIAIKGAQRKSDIVFSGFCAQESTNPAHSVDWDQIYLSWPGTAPYRPYWRYQWLAQATGGMLGNSNLHNYLVSETEDLAQTVSGFRKWFPLSVAPDLDAGPVTVTVNGTSWPQTNALGDPVWSYDTTTHRVVFASVLAAPPKGATVDISYPTACQ